MKKVLLSILILLILVVAGGLFYVKRTGASQLAGYLSQLFGVPVKVGELDLEWNRVTVKKLSIANPEPSPLEYAFFAPRIEIDLSFVSLLTEDIYVEMVEFDDPTLGIDLYNTLGSKNNWATLISNIPQKESPSSKEVTIDYLRIAPLNLTLHTPTMGNNVKKLNPIPQIELHNIGRGEDGVNYAVAANVISQAIISTVINQTGLSTLLNSVVRLPQNTLNSVLTPVKKVIINPVEKFFNLFRGNRGAPQPENGG